MRRNLRRKSAPVSCPAAAAAHAAFVRPSRRATIAASASANRRNLFLAGRMPDRHAQGTRIVAKTHRFQDMAGPDLARRAGRAGRQRDAGEVEGDLRRLRLHAGNGKEDGVGQPFGIPAENLRVRHEVNDDLFDPVPLRSALRRCRQDCAAPHRPRRRSQLSRRGFPCRRGGPSPGRRRAPAAPASSGPPWRRWRRRPSARRSYVTTG